MQYLWLSHTPGQASFSAVVTQHKSDLLCVCVCVFFWFCFCLVFKREKEHEVEGNLGGVGKEENFDQNILYEILNKKEEEEEEEESNCA